MTKIGRFVRAALAATVLALASGLAMGPGALAGGNRDVLYVGDGVSSPPSPSDNTVKRFDAKTGSFLGKLVDTPVSTRLGIEVNLVGPRGLVLNAGSVFVVNQNANLKHVNGEVLRYDAATGELRQRVVPSSDPAAPFAPRGMILWNDRLFVADFNPDGKDGSVRTYNSSEGTFLAALAPSNEQLRQFGFEFHPRGVVIGPDRRLYVSNFPNLGTGLGGQVLQFNPESGQLTGLFINNDGHDTADCTDMLNRPEGLAFGPDGNLYITSFRANAGDTDKILVFAGPGSQQPGACLDLDRIDLDQANQPRSAAQALLFGPNGDLFVPISNAFAGVEGQDKQDTGAIRRYRIGCTRTATRTCFTYFVCPSAGKPGVCHPPGNLGQPWFLSFGGTDPATLAYGG